jgi:anti-sigma regulatory factor (Ser/Thr protein kinase)/CheY-like chemotaxis protein
VDQQPDDDWLLQHASTLQEASMRLKRRRFDVVMLDLRSCATCDPSDTVEHFRSIREDAKIIAFASQTEAKEVLEVIRAHAFAFFTEPWEPADVLEMVRKAVEDPAWEDGVDLISAEPDFIALRLRCRLLTAERIVHFMKALRAGIPEQERADAAMAFRELLMNAIEHGGKMDPNVWVRVSRVRTKRTLVYHVQDPGSGFKMAHLRHAAINNPPDDPVAHMAARQEAGMRSGGFGLLVASNMVDEVIYNERGNEVILIKHLA